MNTAMSPKLSRQRAEACANAVIDDDAITNFPVNPRTIAAKREILVEARDSTKAGVSGFLIKIGDSFGIGYSKHIDNEGFINFTIAHELGHYFLPGHPQHLFAKENLVHESISGFVSNDPYEREADFFAAALLMPEKLFATAARSVGQGFAAVNALAQRCGTSLTATAIRYSQFVEFPVAVILSEGDRIECCFVSDLLKDVRGVVPLRKGDLVPTHTPTAKFNASPGNSGSCNTERASCFLNDWFDDAPRFEMNEDVVGLGTYGKTLTVLFTSDEITNEDEDDGE